MFVDMHCDTMLTMQDKIEGQFSLNEAYEMGGGIQVFACCTAANDSKTPFEDAVAAIRRFKETAESDERIEIVYNLKDAEKIALDGKVAAILTLEGCDALEGRLQNLETFYEMGVRGASLTWNGENDLASGCGSSGGVKPFGKEVLRFLENNHMIVDAAHLNNESFWDVLKSATGPVISSHCCSFDLCPHERNITEEMFRALMVSGGGAAVTFYPPFLTGTNNADITDILRHIDFFMNLSAGTKVGLGSDFDGVEYLPDGILSTADLAKLQSLLEKEYGKPQAENVMSENMIEILRRI